MCKDLVCRYRSRCVRGVVGSNFVDVLLKRRDNEFVEMDQSNSKSKTVHFEKIFMIFMLVYAVFFGFVWLVVLFIEERMEECIPSAGFFTAKRPSFRATPHAKAYHHHTRYGGYNMRSQVYNASPMGGHHHRRSCGYYNNVGYHGFIEEHRRMHSQQRGFYGERGGVYYNRCVKVGVPQGVFAQVGGCFRGRRGGGVGQVRREEGGGYGGCEVRGEEKVEEVQRVCGPQMLYNYDSPEVVVRRKRAFPVQIPIQAIHFNEELFGEPVPDWSGRQVERVGGLEEQEELQQLLIENRVRSLHEQMCRERGIPQQFETISVPEVHLHAFEDVSVQHQGLQLVQQQQFEQNVHQGPVQQQGSQYHGEGSPYVVASGKLIEAARVGFDLFRKDFEEGMEEEILCRSLEGVSLDLEDDNLRFVVDDRGFKDGRSIKSYVEEGGREFKIFEERWGGGRDMVREVYNVNEIDCFDVKEVCGVKVLPKTLQVWPLEVIGNNWGKLKKRLINYTGGFGSCGEYIKENRGSWGDDFYGEEERVRTVGNPEVGEYGVQSLAKFFWECQGGRGNGVEEQYPLRFITFIGMNMNKLMRDLECTRPLTQTFVGPLADRNNFYDFTGMEVKNGFREYDLPFEPDCEVWGRGEDAYDWTRRHRITRYMFPYFCFDLLLYIFYSIPGDAMQLLAAKELYERGWRYHKVYQVWLTPWKEGKEDGRVREEDWESGVYKYFHYGKWGFFKGEFKINWVVLEGRPVCVEGGLWEWV